MIVLFICLCSYFKKSIILGWAFTKADNLFDQRLISKGYAYTFSSLWLKFLLQLKALEHELYIITWLNHSDYSLSMRTTHIDFDPHDHFHVEFKVKSHDILLPFLTSIIFVHQDFPMSFEWAMILNMWAVQTTRGKRLLEVPQYNFSSFSNSKGYLWYISALLCPLVNEVLAVLLRIAWWITWEANLIQDKHLI